MKIKSRLQKMFYNLMDSNSPNFIIIGAQKAGTSSLYFYLNQHPNLKGSKTKELHYFDIERHFNKTIADYEKNFKAMFRKNALFFEATPSYLYHESAAKEIAAIYPDIKLIIILRDPIKRAFSAWNMYRNIAESGNLERLKNPHFPGLENPIYKYFVNNRKSFPSFKECLEIELELIADNQSNEPALLRRGLYYEQIKSYCKYFRRNQILILGFKDLISETADELDGIYNFLGVSKFPIKQLKLEVQNKKSYKTELLSEDYLFLKDYYDEPNKKLFNFLGKEINW